MSFLARQWLDPLSALNKLLFAAVLDLRLSPLDFIDNNIIPILSGENLNMIVLDYKEDQYKKIISNSKRNRKYYIEKIEEITNEKIINLM